MLKVLPILLLGAALLASCGGAPGPVLVMQASTPYRPPTPAGFQAAPTETPTGSPAQAASRAAPEIECVDNLTFIADVTIPDGTEVVPESTLDKRWEVQNSGSCSWNEDYRIRLIAGPALGAQEEQALYPARSGSRAMIRIMFKAPAEPGDYRSAWQAFNAQGEPFGDPFFIDVIIEGAQTTNP